MYLVLQVSHSEGVPDLPRPPPDVAGEHGEQAHGAGQPCGGGHVQDPLRGSRLGIPSHARGREF